MELKAIEEVVRLQDKPMPSIPSIFGKNVSAETPSYLFLFIRSLRT